MEKTMQKSRRYSGACDFGFAIADFGLKDPREDPATTGQAVRTQSKAFDYPLVIFTLLMFILQRIGKERKSKWPVAECFAKHLLNRAEALNSQNGSKPRARIADCFPASLKLSLPDCIMQTGGVELPYLYHEGGLRLPMQDEEMTGAYESETRFHPDRIFVPRPTSLVPLKRMYGKTNSNGRIPTKRVFTN